MNSFKFEVREKQPNRALHLIATRVTLPAVAALLAGSAPRAALGEL